MLIEFSDEAAESFQNTILKMVGYTLEVTPLGVGAPFDAVLVDIGSEWYDELEVRLFDEELSEPVGEPFTIRVKKVKVY